ncbi:MAG TPA: folylpolyglutamate synthase/dihydrofolate synthase family protein [Chloroflexota bacterium]|nr:folylpolyglutamate synthase/dihydrofolate synthase family protein [Chloroflexota bacterium]
MASAAYTATLAYLYGLTDWERRPMDRSTREQLLLQRPAALLERLGQPQRSYPSILIAGTKGKGSTAAFLEAILRAAGYRTGFYSQPHLHTYRERIRVDGRCLGEGEVVAGIARIRPHLQALERDCPALGRCTTYEVSTALALDHFARAGVEVAVLEVGLGGRLDATNVVEAEVAVITSISFDHTAILGDTLPQIAAEKAGIIKPGRPVLVAPQRAEALAVLEQVAAARTAPLLAAGRDWTWQGHHQGLSVRSRGQRWSRAWRATSLSVPLLGSHQLENAATAVATAHALAGALAPGEAWHPLPPPRRGAERGPQRGARRQAAPAPQPVIPPQAIAAGVSATRWPARLEVVRPAGPAVVIDGAHNGDSAAKLGAALRDHFLGVDRPAAPRLWLVIGTGADKDLSAIVAPLAPLSRGAWAVASRHPRHRPAAEVSAALRAAGVAATAAPDTAAGLAAALAAAGPQDVVCVTGSLFVAAEAREALGLVPPQDLDPVL